METLLFLTLGGAAALAAWKTGFPLGMALRGGAELGRAARWLSDGGAWTPLAHRLALRDIHVDVIECADGWLWAGGELIPVATDGLSNGEINALGATLNRALGGLAAETRVQTITAVSDDFAEPLAILERQLDACRDAVWHAMLRARVAHLHAQAQSGRARQTRTRLLVGRRLPKTLNSRFRLGALLAPDAWTDAAAADWERTRSDAHAALAALFAALRPAGATGFPLSGDAIKNLIYARLNPERARRHPAPGYHGDCNPRELLCFTSAETLRSGFIVWGETPGATISLKRLPVRTCATLLETLTRSAEIDFPFELSSHFLVEDSLRADEALERQEIYAANALDQQRLPNRDEIVKLANLAEIRTATRVGEDKLVTLGLGVTVFAPDVEQLRTRCDRLLTELRRCEGMEGLVDRHSAIAQHLATLPGQSPSDARAKRALSRDAAALAGWTGGPRGLPAHEATLIFQRPDGGLFFFDPAARAFNSGMALFCGGTGSGKSTLMGFLAQAHLAAGRIGVIFDYGGSYRRLALAAGADAIDIADAKRAAGLGLLAIAPRPGEEFAPEDLTPEGLPIERLQQVCNILENLCLDPHGAERALPAHLRAHLQHGVARAYANKGAETPTLDYLIRSLQLGREGREKDFGEDLAARLSVYAAAGPLGRFFNDGGERLDPRAPLTVFDFRSVRGDARLMQVATLAVETHLHRFTATGRGVAKFLIADELQEIARFPVIVTCLDRAFRTARKNHVSGMVGSQKASDFQRPGLDALAVNCEVKWLYEMDAETARQAFNLSLGEAKLVGRLQTHGPDYRDCALISPLGAAHLRLRFSAAELRLFAGATTGAETISVAAAVAATPGEIPERLLAAWDADALGERRSPPLRQLVAAS
jgi:type IV secretory pathway VirB4 component